jgi:trypsin/pre-peptidase
VQREPVRSSVAAIRALAFAAVVLASGVCDARPVSAPIVGGETTADYPAVGALLVGASAATARTACTVSLVGCRTVVTAAHCVCPTTGKECQNLDVPPSLFVYFAHAGFFTVESIRVHRDYRFPTADLAVLQLATTVTGIEPLLPNDVDAPELGSDGTIVGFGWETAATADSGLKRDGAVATASCAKGVSDATSVCWEYTGDDADTCGPDAGGPLLIDMGYGPTLAGVVSGEDSSTCLPTDQAHATDVFAYLNWIEQAADGDLYTWQCDDVPAVGADEVSTEDFTDELGSAQTSVVESVDVGMNATELRVALQGSEHPGTDFDLYVRHGDEATPAAFDCSGVGSGQYAFCRIMNPEYGTWFLRAERVAGEGPVQLVATVIGGDYPECGNGIREPGEDCDDTDLGTCTAGCDDDCYCVQCSDTDLDVRQIELWPKLYLGAMLGDAAGTWAEIDPSIDGITFELSDGAHTAPVEIPGDDPGWVIAKPERGRFRWRGGQGSPIRRLDLSTNPKRPGRWRLVLKGKDVPATDAVDLASLVVRVKIGSSCAQRGFRHR